MPSPTAPPTGPNVFSIVEALDRRRLEETRKHAVASHRRDLQATVESMQHLAAVKGMDLDATLAWIEDHPIDDARATRSELRALRALQSCLRGELDAGLAEWADVIAEEPSCTHAYVLRARWVMQTDPSAALVDFDRAVEASPTDATLYARRGDCLRALGDPDRALANYRRAVTLNPSDFDAHHAIARILAAQGDHDEAIAACSRAIQLAPRYADFVFDRAASRTQVGDLDGAAADLLRVVELDPERADARVRYAMCLWDSGAEVAAIEAMTEVTRLLPGERDAHCMLGELQLATGHPAEAIEAFSRALSVQPDDAATLVRRAVAHGRGGDREAAVADCDRAIALDPGHAYAHMLRAIHRSHLDAPDEEVLADIDRAIELAPDEASYVRERGGVRMHREEYDLAVPDFDRAIALAPRVATLYYERAYCRNRIFDEGPDRAAAERARAIVSVVDLERAIELGRGDGDVFTELWEAHRQNGDAEAQRATLDRACAAVPDDAMLAYLRYRARRRDGDLAGAAADRARAEALGFDFRDIPGDPVSP